MFGCDQTGNSNLIVANFLHKSSQYTQNACLSTRMAQRIRRVGAGVFSPEMPGNISHRFSAETSIFSAEF